MKSVRCKVCNRIFKIYKYRLKDAKYCSRKCQHQSMKHDRHEKRKRLIKICPICNKQFEVINALSRIRCCSKLCGGKYRTLHNSGVNSKLYKVSKTEEHKKNVSIAVRKAMTLEIKEKSRLLTIKAMQRPEVREKMKKSWFKKGQIGLFKGKKRPELSKENHWNWKNGKTPLAFAIRILLENKLWIEQVFQRDNYICQECGKRGGNLEVHHIKEFNQILDEFIMKYNQFSIIEDREILIHLATAYQDFWDIDNGKTLCEECHNKTKINVRK